MIFVYNERYFNYKFIENYSSKKKDSYCYRETKRLPLEMAVSSCKNLRNIIIRFPFRLRMIELDN